VAGDEAVLADSSPLVPSATGNTLVVIVNYNGGAALCNCVASIAAQNARATVVVVDNGSTDGSDALVRASFPDVTVSHAPTNLGFGPAVNHAVAAYAGDPIVILNPDVSLHEGCLEALTKQLDRRPGVVGPVLHVHASDSEEAGWTVNHTGMPTVQAPGKPPLYVPGCVLATNRTVFERVAGFDERYFLFVEDVEYCWRALIAGYEVSIAPGATADHVGGGTAEGGYLRPGTRYRTSDLRVALRERNNVALLLSCSPWWWSPVLVPVLIGHALAIAAGAAVMGRRRLATEIVRGIVWNVRQAPATIRRRRSLARTRSGCRNARARLTTGALVVRTMRAHGWPDVR